MKKSFKLILFIVFVFILGVFIYNIFPLSKSDQILSDQTLIEQSKDLKILSEKIEDFKVYSDYLTDIIEIEEGYNISIQNSSGLLFIVNDVPNNIDDYVLGFNKMFKNPQYVVVNDRYIFIFDKSDSDILSMLQLLKF